MNGASGVSGTKGASGAERYPLSGYREPRFWPVWALWWGLRLAARLPFAWELRLGRALGRVLRRVKRRERRVAARNLEICFPSLSAQERERLLRAHFEAVGISFFEMAIGWFWPIDKLREIVHVEGREHLEAAIARHQGVILLAAHFTCLEVGAGILEDLCPRCSGMYRPQRNAMMDAIIKRGRSRFAQHLIARDNVRLLIRRLRAGDAVVYLPDQTYLGNQSELLPFFGEPAVTNTATSKLAKVGGALVLPYFFRRLPNTRGYVVRIGAPLENFPSDDAAADTRRWVALLERSIEEAPEQYLWLYKKFKGRPPPFPDVYAPPE